LKFVIFGARHATKSDHPKAPSPSSPPYDLWSLPQGFGMLGAETISPRSQPQGQAEKAAFESIPHPQRANKSGFLCLALLAKHLGDRAFC
jgi:hypothetical protein